MDTKVIGRRIGAAAIDLVIAWIVVIIVALAVLQSIDVSGNGDLGQDGCDLINDEYPLCFYADESYLVGTGGDLALLIAVGLGTWFALRIVPQAITGRTLGKKIFGITAVDESGAAPGWGKSILREVLWIVDSLPFLYLVGIITAAASKRNQRVGDMAASTLVIRASTAAAAYGSPDGSDTAAPPMAAGPAPARPGDPVWDPTRNAYVHRDPATGREQIYDQASGTWHDA